MSIRAAILGASGYGGGELLRLLGGHPRVRELVGSSRRFFGKPIASVHPNLRGVNKDEFVQTIDWTWLSDCEHPVLFAAMPHGEFGRQYARLQDEWEAVALRERLTVIDLSADFRIRDPHRYEKYYNEPHPCPSSLEEWDYGFCEYVPVRLLNAKRIANPGCFASALQLGLLPLAGMREIEFVAASGATGSSGSGMNPSETTHHPARSNDFRAYKILNHQHMAEIQQLLETVGWGQMHVSFIPHSAPMVRGILTTLQFQMPEGMYAEDLRKLFLKSYGEAKFVRLVEGSPRVAAVVGSNFADIGITVHDGYGAVLVALDNLIKGMAGQAVQNMNLSLGLPEEEGLWFVGGYPY